MEAQRPQRAQAIFRRRSHAGDITMIHLTVYAMELWQWNQDGSHKQTHAPVEQRSGLRNKCTQLSYSHLIFDEGVKNTLPKKTARSENAWNAGNSHVKDWEQWAGNAAPLLEVLPSIHKALSSIPALRGTGHGSTCLQSQHLGGQGRRSEVQRHFSCLENARPAWTTWHPEERN